MADTDTLVLGGIEFSGFAAPEAMPGGGKQHVVKHQLPGGDRVVDAMGADDDDRTWSGIFFSEDALERCATLDAMRKQGLELAFSWGFESRTCVITGFTFEARKVQHVTFKITVMFTDTSAADGGAGATPSLDAMVSSDLGQAGAVGADDSGF